MTEEDLLDYVSDMEKNWKAQLEQTLPKTDSEWLKVFPEARKIIPEKIKEWETQAEIFRLQIKPAVQLVEEKSAEEDRWFWRGVVKYSTFFFPVTDLAIANRHIKRLKWLSKRGKKKVKWHTDLQTVRNQNIIAIARSYGLKLLKSGRNYKALCPFHNEKTASFTIYPPSRFYCFGCNEKGSVIDLVMKMENCTFKEAVKKLQSI